MHVITPRHLHFGAHYVEFPLPSSIDDNGLMMTEWQLSRHDIDRVICGGHVRLWVYMHEYLRPVSVEVMDPEQNVVHES